MKVFSKFLAVTLALLTVLTLIPFSVFAKASEPWLEVEGDEGVDAPVLTVKVDAGVLMDLLRADEESDLLPALQSGIRVNGESLRDVFTATELFEIIPREEWLKILPVEEFVNAIGAEEMYAKLNLETLAPYIFWEFVLDIVGGDVEKAKEYIAHEDDVLAVADLDRLIQDFGVEQVLSYTPVTALMDQFSMDDFMEMISKVDLASYATPLFALVFRKTLSNVDEIVIDGELIASEDDTQLLSFNSAALVKVLKKICPSLSDIANTEDGKIVSTHVAFKYTVDGTQEQKSKEMILEIVLDGDLSGEKALAQKVVDLLDRYVSYSYNNGTLTADIKLPAGFAKLFGEVLDSDLLSADTKQKLLGVASWDGEKLVGVLKELTAADLVEILGAIDVEKLGEIALQQAYVQKCLEIASQYAGIDMTDMDLNELLDASVKVPGLKKISEVIEERYGVDVYAALEKYETVDELYQAALAKAEANEEAFASAIDLVLKAIHTFLPESAMNKSLMSSYNGNGSFALNTTLTLNTKSIVSKILKRVVSLVDPDISAEAVDVLLAQVSLGVATLKLDLSLQVADLYAITYKDKATDKTLFTAFLPVGADLSVFNDKDAIGGYEILGWVDEEGNAISTMPARDVVVYADYQGGGTEEKEEFTVTFVNKDGALLGTLTTYSDETLAEQVAAIAEYEKSVQITHEKAQYLYDSCKVVWKYYNAETGAVGSRFMPTRTAVTENITVIADVAPNYYLKIEDVDYDVTLDSPDSKTMNFTLQIHEELPESFVLDMDWKILLQLANMTYNVKLDVIVGEKQYKFFSMDDALLASLRKTAKTQVTFHFDTVSANAANSLYANDENASFFIFEIRTDDVPYTQNFVSDLYLTLPYENALVGGADASCATRVHLLYADGSRELVEGTVENGFVTIKASHFSEYVISNEYKVNMNFVSTEASDPTAIFGAWKGQSLTDFYFPAGCELKAIPVVSAENVGNYTWVSTSYQLGEAVGSFAYGELFVMPASEMNVTVTVQPRECSVYYYALGTQMYKDTYFFYQTVAMRALDDPAVMAKDPDGTPSMYSWIGFDESLIGKCDMYVHAKWNNATYYVQFIGRNGLPVETIAYDESSFYTVVAPAVPLEAGYVGAWSAYDLKSAFGQEDGYVLKVNAVYTEASFKIFSGDNVVVVDSAKYGDTVKVTAPDKIGYDKIIIVTLANNTTQTVEGGVFVMPESEVYVDVTYVPHTYSYTINGWTYEGKMNETVTFDITVPRGKVLAAVPKGCVLANIELASDNSLVLTYSFVLTEDGTNINWKWSDSEYGILQIINGKLFDGEGVPTSTNEDAVFLGWTSIVADNLQFAIFGVNEEPVSFVWLWILIILLVLIGVIVLFYLLHKAGKIGANAFVRAILWIVNLFFTVCIAIAELGLKIVGLFKKNSDAE